MPEIRLYPTTDPPPIESDPRADEAVKAIQEKGFVVLENLLELSEVAEIKRELEPHLGRRLTGRNDFEGYESERVYALLTKSATAAQLIDHPRLLAIADRLLAPHYLLSAHIAINIHPGETAQPWHFDDDFTPDPRPRSPYGVSCICAIDDFNEKNGATEVIPGSHLWGEEPLTERDSNHEVIAIPAGSAVVFPGTLYHRGGTNQSTSTRMGISTQYCQPWLRQIENMPLAVPPTKAKEFSSRVQELLGYSIMEPSFMGYVNGRHPKKLIHTHGDE